MRRVSVPAFAFVPLQPQKCTCGEKKQQKLASIKNLSYLCGRNIEFFMNRLQVIDSIKQVAARVLPKGSTLYLYGSRARGDYHDDSDWDLLLLVDKPKLKLSERENMEFPFTEKGWEIGEDLSARAFTKEEWYNGPRSLFFYNVEEDKELIYES